MLRLSGFGVAGLIAAMLLATYPVLFYAAGTLYPQTVGVFLLLLVLGSRDQASVRSTALAGVVFGLLILCIPSMLPMFALMPWLFCRPRPGRLAAIYALSALLVMALWTVRNYRVFHDFIPVSTNSGINLLFGNSEHAGADTGDMVDVSRYNAQTQGMSEAQADRFFRREALVWIAQHKPQAFRLYALKFFNYFNRYSAN